MIRTLIRRELGTKIGSILSKRLQKTLLWPTWVVFDLGDSLEHNTVDQLLDIMRWHNRLGVRDFIFTGMNLFNSPEIVRLVQRSWSVEYRTWLSSSNSRATTNTLIEAARSGANGIAVIATSQDDLENINEFIDVYLECPDTDFRIVASIDLNTVDAGKSMIDTLVKTGLALDVDVGIGELNDFGRYLQDHDLVSEPIAGSEIKTNWALIASRGCSCLEPFSGWYIDKSYAARLCREREALGDLTQNRIRQDWLSTQALHQQVNVCNRHSTFRGLVWRKSANVPNSLKITDSQPTVSVVIPSFGRPAEQIAKTLNALLEQDYDPEKYEIILVDDGDPARAAKKAVRLTPEPSRIEYLQVPHGGAASARNHGIRIAVGDIVAFTDDDCEPTRNWLRELVKGFNDEKVGGIGGLTLPMDSNSLIVRFLDQRRALRRFLTDKDVASPDIIPTANAAYRRSVLEEVGGFSPAFAFAGIGYGGEDRFLTWRVLQEGYIIQINLNARVYHQHRHSLWQLVEQGYQYGCGCYLHCRLSGLPFDYEPRLKTQLSVIMEYLLPYYYWIQRYYLKGASLGDAFIFPVLDFLRRAASAWGAYITHRRIKDHPSLKVHTGD